ncbi:Ccm2-related protein [Helicobacter ailurogastricus]|uniref:Ccm2-related protein n=1 Tax=Helicobacter ailurogastricus TaxID=1578720 RepID=A0A0K2Y183_9HELI|nr:Ccm2-related protein [Helicobacter ailurogastricus]
MIGKNGVVMGDIFAVKLVVSGKFNGNTEVDTIEIMPLGYVDGKIVSSELVIERKGILTGESHPRSDVIKSLEESKAAKPS